MRLGLDLSLTGRRSSGAASIPGSALTVPPTAPYNQWHSAYGVTAAGSPSRVTAVVDQKGVANLSEGLDATSLGGPEVVTDGLGRPVWEFSGDAYLNVANTFSATQQSFGVVAVIQYPRTLGGYPFFSFGNVTNGTPCNTGAANLGFGTPEAFVRGSTISASSAASNKHMIIAGAQVQVVAMFSQAGKQRLYVNNEVCEVAVTVLNATGTGAEIGRYSNSPGTKTGANYNDGSWFQGSVYEIMTFKGALSDAAMDAIVAATVTNWGITAVTSQVVMDGDSITQGATVKPNYVPSALLCKPGVSGTVPAYVRVLNKGTNGDKVPQLVAKRDASNSIYGLTKLSGKNIILFEIGRNDMAGGTPDSAATCYSNIVAYLHTTTTGVLERGWEVIAGVNIATSNGAIQGRIDSLRVLMRDIATFRTDTTATSATLTLADFPLITLSAVTLFNTTGDAGSGTYYSGGGGTHLTAAGNYYKVYGGDDASKGMAAIINARLAA